MSRAKIASECKPVPIKESEGDMRINVSSISGFFHDERYPEFERLLAAMAAGCMWVEATHPAMQIDVQVNPVVNARPAGQYVYVPDGKTGRFSDTPKNSGVTMEIDHVNEQQDREEVDNEQLMCLAAIVLLAAVYGEWMNQNCWSKMHGSKTGETGWAEGMYPSEVVRWTHELVEQFANNNVSADDMVDRLTKLLVRPE